MRRKRPGPYGPGRQGFTKTSSPCRCGPSSSIQRDPESVLPGLIVPVFFFAAIVGAMKDLAETVPGVDYKEFQVPVAIIFAVTGISRAVTLVIDIQSGYFDRLSISPVNRLALLLGHMVADFALVVALTIPVIIMGLIIGVGFGTGFGGALVFIVLSGLWGLVFTGFPYAIALKTGEPGSGKHDMAPVHALLIPDHHLLAERGNDGLDGRHRPV